ncbi:TfuA-like protein [Actinomadura rupiterrae]|uniref:TfuA-like protein n=1 Tax=Actinomadura rupiterrae TaxID=559627 RepID=UPI0020A440CF|nr:TfuA-like protein [Actinomadura rupiterrae]MCP2342051.1 hypothetical protein [Actinomadura rupiterrae]
MNPGPTLHVFAGPTLAADRIRALAATAIVHPPVQHGDLLRLAARRGDIVLIIDGLWHQVPPVRHKEILELLANDVRVVGAASMGALRAAELAPYGMIGVGWVYQQYATGQLDADDEVAVTQTPSGAPLSTALVCLRYRLNAAADAGAITAGEAAQLVELARALPYQRRSWKALHYAAASTDLAGACQRAVDWNDHYGETADIKAVDAELALTFAATGHLPEPADQPGWQQQPWRTSHLRSWAATYRPVAIANGARVPLTALLHHAQLYDPHWPERWRRHVLAWIASLPTDTASRLTAPALEDQALAAAHHRGLHLDSLTRAQVQHWATPSEISELSPREILLRLVTRSARLDPTASVWPETPQQARALLDLDAHARAAVHAWTTSQKIAATGPGRIPAHLDPTRIRRQLADHWNLDTADSAALTAAARDRGILSIQEAVETARPFYLAARR